MEAFVGIAICLGLIVLGVVGVKVGAWTLECAASYSLPPRERDAFRMFLKLPRSKRDNLVEVTRIAEERLKRNLDLQKELGGTRIELERMTEARDRLQTTVGMLEERSRFATGQSMERYGSMIDLTKKLEEIEKKLRNAEGETKSITARYQAQRAREARLLERLSVEEARTRVLSKTAKSLSDELKETRKDMSYGLPVQHRPVQVEKPEA